jgi:hypothetical protein
MLTFGRTHSPVLKRSVPLRGEGKARFDEAPVIRQNFILLQDTSHWPHLTSINNVRSHFLSY